MRTVRYLWMAGSFNCFTAEAQRTQGSAEKSSGNQLVVSEQSAMIETIRANAMRITELQKAVNRTVRSRHLSPAHHEAWKIACSAFHSEYEALAFPGGLEVAYDLIKGKDSSVVEPAIAFLEVDPLFHRSGYLKAALVRALATMDLNPSHRTRLRQVILDRVQGPTRREFRKYCNLARVITTPAFVERLDKLKSHPTKSIARNAQWVLEAIATMD